MAFSLRKMLSNITYFKKPEDEDNCSGDAPIGPDSMETRPLSQKSGEISDTIDFERIEPDSTSKHATSLKLPESVKNFAAKKGSLSDTDLLSVSVDTGSKKEKRKSKKLKLDIKKANKATVENDEESVSDNVENTPKHVLLECRSAEFSERIKKFNFSNSFDIFDAMSDEECMSEEGSVDVESMSDTETDVSIPSNKEKSVKMCRKVDEKEESDLDSSVEDTRLASSATPESFADVEGDNSEEDRITLLLNYQMRLEKLECFLKKLLTEFQFHIEVSKVFHSRSIGTPLPDKNTGDAPKSLGEATYMDNINRGVSPTGSWNIILENEDGLTKSKLKNQLLSMKYSIDKFVNNHLRNHAGEKLKCKQWMGRQSTTFDLYNGARIPHKRLRISNKKNMKRFDYPDYREAMINLFCPESEKEITNIASNNLTNLLNYSDETDTKCVCRCHMQSPVSQTDSGLTSKSNDQSLSITSSIGNFCLDSSTLTAYSESLDQIISYNSFEDSSLFSTLLQRAAIERITFYVQVHSIQLKCEQTEEEYESKNVITFHCPSCKSTETEENGLLKHILSQYHCEKLHFVYKTAYIKKCVQSGKEIQPSTVLNPMKMYRDENKIVCFGDAMYACSLCFENLIVGESVLMAHCSEADHMDRRERLCEILE